MAGGCFVLGVRLSSHLDEEERLQQEVEQHVGDDFADAGKGMRLPAGHFERQIRDVLRVGEGRKKQQINKKRGLKEMKFKRETWAWGKRSLKEVG